jgi:hypothetical protein
MPANRFVVAAVGVLLASAGVQAADVPAHRNAALQYWLAFERLPKYNLSDVEKKLLDEWQTAPFTPENVEILRRWQSPLIYLHRGAELKDCVWPSALNAPRDGIGVLMPQQDARTLAAVALLRARYRFECGRPEAGFDDVLAVVRLARHVGRDGGLIALLIERSVEEQAIRCVAGNLGWAARDRDALRVFLRKWDKLPRATTVADAIAAERDEKVAWFRFRGVDVASDTEPDLEGNPAPRNRADRVATIKYLLGLQLESGSVREFIAAFDREYGRAIEIAGMPLDEARSAQAEWNLGLEKNVAGYDPVVRTFIGLGMPDVYKMRLGQARLEVVRLMFRAAVAAAAEGKDIPGAVPDPHGDGPFEVTRTAEGYTLRSKLSELLAEAAKEKRLADNPAVLTVRTTRSPR